MLNHPSVCPMMPSIGMCWSTMAFTGKRELEFHFGERTWPTAATPTQDSRMQITIPAQGGDVFLGWKIECYCDFLKEEDIRN